MAFPPQDRETVIAKVSGETVIAKISGETVSIASGSVVQISGNVVTLSVPTTVRTQAMLAVTGASGGAALGSGVTNAVVVKAFYLNSGNVWVGGSSYTPYSGYGLILGSGESVALDVNNFNAIYVFAEISGDKVTALAV